MNAFFHCILHTSHIFTPSRVFEATWATSHPSRTPAPPRGGERSSPSSRSRSSRSSCETSGRQACQRCWGACPGSQRGWRKGLEDALGGPADRRARSARFGGAVILGKVLLCGGLQSYGLGYHGPIPSSFMQPEQDKDSVGVVILLCSLSQHKQFLDHEPLPAFNHTLLEHCCKVR